MALQVSRSSDAAAVDDVPLLVRLLAGNPATSAAILACLNTVDASRLRQLHPAVAGILVGVAWCDTDTAVVDPVRWRAAVPAAVSARVSPRLVGGLTPLALAALEGITRLDLQDCRFVTDDLLLRLPTSLRVLNVSCTHLTRHASFTHLTALTVLDCSWTSAVFLGAAGLPASLQELDISNVYLPAETSLAHLAHLRVLRAKDICLDAVTLASLSPCLLELRCSGLPPGMLFGHFPALHTLDVPNTAIDDASLASMPSSLAFLNAGKCGNLTRAAVLPPLPSLRLLDVCGTRVGDRLVASLPAGLAELRMSCCSNVTAGATLDHVPALQTLHSLGTDLAPDVLAGCRSRGCTVPAAGMLLGHGHFVSSLALVGDGWLASGDVGGEVRAWDLTEGGGEAGVPLFETRGMVALAALWDGHCLAAGLWDGGVEVWDVGVEPPVRTAAVDCHHRGVWALAVLSNSRLAAGCGDGMLWIIDVEEGEVVAELEEHTGRVTALEVLPDGALVSGSWDESVCVWDVGSEECLATLAGHSGCIRALAVLADDRLASGSDDCTVRLWVVGPRATCVGVLAGHAGPVAALAALPDGRLVTGSYDGTLRVWDTRPAAAGAGSDGAAVVPMVAITLGFSAALALPLPDGRVVCVDRDSEGAVQLLHVPPPAPYD